MCNSTFILYRWNAVWAGSKMGSCFQQPSLFLTIRIFEVCKVRQWTADPCTQGTCDKTQLSPKSPPRLDQDLKIHKYHHSLFLQFFQRRPEFSCWRSSTMELNNSATPWAPGRVSANWSGAAAGRKETGSTHLPAREASFIIYAVSTLGPHIFVSPWQCFPLSTAKALHKSHSILEVYLVI